MCINCLSSQNYLSVTDREADKCMDRDGLTDNAGEVKRSGDPFGHKNGSVKTGYPPMFPFLIISKYHKKKVSMAQFLTTFSGGGSNSSGGKMGGSK